MSGPFMRPMRPEIVAALTEVISALATNDAAVDAAIATAEQMGLPSDVVANLREINNAMYRRRLRSPPEERKAWARFVAATSADMDSMHVATSDPTEENIQNHAAKNAEYWETYKALSDLGVDLKKLLSHGEAPIPPCFAWRGNVTDLAVDIRAVLTKEQRDQLASALRPATAEPFPDPSTFGTSLWFGYRDLGTDPDPECLYIGDYGDWMAYTMTPEKACAWASVLIDYAAGKPVAAYPADDPGPIFGSPYFTRKGGA